MMYHMIAQRYDNHHWFAHGVMWDALDKEMNSENSKRKDVNGNGVNKIIDNCFLGENISPNSMYPIFNQLNSNVDSPTSLKNALINAYPSEKDAIIELFDSYGY